MIILIFNPKQDLRNSNLVAEKLAIMDYKKAKSITASFFESEPKYFKSLESLTSILIHKGQDSRMDFDAINLIRRRLEIDGGTVLDSLGLAYHELYYSRINEDAHYLFESIYQGLKKSKNRGLKKLTLIGSMILFSRENTLNEKQFDYYHSEFEKLAQLPDELALSKYYRNFFDGMSAGTPETYAKSISDLYNFLIQNHNKISDHIKIYMYQNIALDFRVKNKIDSAEVYLGKIIKVPPSKYERKLLFNTYLELGRIYTLKNELSKAVEFWGLAKDNYDVHDTIHSKVLFDRYLAFNYYENLKLYDSAYYSLKTSRLNEAKKNYAANNSLISELNTKLRTKEKEKQILVEQQKVRTNRNWLIAAILALLLGSGIAVLLQKNTSKKRQLAEQEALLKQQRVDNLLKEQELLSIDAMISGQEKERQKVAGELHDDLGSLMATIKLHFDNAKFSKQDPALQNAQKLLEEAYQKIRGMAHSKNSGVMSDQGLLPTIKKMAKTITETNTLEVTVEDFGLGERMENSLELSIFRIVQELVTNAIKHAEASKVNIQLTQHDDNLNIIVEDDGLGFDSSKVEKRDSGMGLTTIEKRVEHLEGNFTIDSLLGKGTSILIDIPI